ncbi:hypothetical protein DLAC_07444 [Tieghemostelium lacteum]|uniref:Uncharacterized protein n=1 Tax=Tieghemostelium lacteum TaxID=361077 RepID=A0A151ZCJ7_TIELA|nr:hypothetical protein DLAC_07444 [Tieghemostelium lacteum]|eukprot:KYQ91668.1 hypothetical protein DLAC_07444 [Tieghemostelium lacteum]
MKLGFPSLFNNNKKLGKKKNDLAPLKELDESRFRVDQFISEDQFTKGKYTQHRILSVCEEGIKIITSCESDVIEELPWSLIKQFNLRENWTEWEICLKDRRKFFFKCEKAYYLHMATDHILDGLIRNNISNDFIDEF